MRHAPVSRVPDATGARTALVLALLALAPLGTGVPAAPPPFAPVAVGGACRLAPLGAGPACACDAIPATLRRALGWPIPLDGATPADLEAVPGVGPALARAIADDRERRGPFADLAALDRVPGIGPATVAKLRPFLVPDADDPACRPRR